MSSKIKKGDNVMVMTGKDKGKTGEVLSVLPAKERLLVRGVNIVKRHTKPSQTAPGGIIERENAIHISNVALVDPTSNKATKIGFRILEDGRKVRFSKSSSEILDA
ncbi:MAG: 50S ribosomal protein L24 [Pseudomonadota bacterium]|jgi:large subunit ribosomal protein L24|nr:50S ribosomal protein L24 [Rhodospirillaceae bacterium]MEC7972710.1 50S ribosomal protein L24 [Pseudomonadota bacterium]MBO90748.1 50S ribosomal protein L24 [Rhodospirillaceae bacterium]MEC9101707.1 50S ribosomal protein L24 [Pseudomonadota bacterium]MED5227597.1 50S ribosomal protein L24 [Pseudomonadota bacterium]|tara:strand:+ start:6667 stop:6984 length:318 start_codon:yes stop_codon:yes gene_type:complete